MANKNIGKYSNLKSINKEFIKRTPFKSVAEAKALYKRAVLEFGKTIKSLNKKNLVQEMKHVKILMDGEVEIKKQQEKKQEQQKKEQEQKEQKYISTELYVYKRTDKVSKKEGKTYHKIGNIKYAMRFFEKGIPMEDVGLPSKLFFHDQLKTWKRDVDTLNHAIYEALDEDAKIAMGEGKKWFDPYRLAEYGGGFMLGKRGEYIPADHVKAKESVDWEDIIATAEKKAINSKYTEYEMNLKAETFADFIVSPHCNYVQKNYIPECCAVTALLDRYYEAFQKNKKSYTPISYDSIIKLLELEKVDGAYPCTINQSMKFFEKYRLGCKFFNAKMELIHEYIPEKQNHQIKLVFYCILSNNHWYIINENIDSLKATKNRTVKLYRPQNKIIAPEKLEKDVFVCDSIIESIDDVIKYLVNNKIEEQVAEFHANDINKILFEMYKTYKPSIYADKNMIKSLSFKVGKIRVSIKSIMCVDQGSDDKHGKIEDEKQLELFDMYMKELKYEVMRTDTMSYWNEQTIAINDNYKIKPRQCNFINNILVGNIIGIDDVRAYTSILKNIERVPVFDTFDRYEQYDGHEIEDYTYYIVKGSNDFIAFETEYTRMYGFLLKQCKYEKVIYYLRPSKFAKINTEKIINNIYSSELDDVNRKNVVNFFTGLLEIKRKRNTFCQIFDNEEEAINIAKDVNGAVVTLLNGDGWGDGWGDILCEPEGDEKLYMVQKTFHSDRCINGYEQIKDIIYCKQIESLIKKRAVLESLEIPVIGVKTDCVFIEERNEKKIKGHFVIGKTLGSVKIERDCRVYNEDIQTTLLMNDLVTLKEVKNIVIQNERDDKETTKHFENNRLFISAKYPGCGKSTLAFKTEGKKLVITRSNRLCYEIKKKGLEAHTLNRVLGLNIAMVENKKARRINVDDYDTIIFDEIFLFHPNELKTIYYMMLEHSDKKFICTGDAKQIPPIGYKDWEQMKNIIEFMFENKITLSEIKRVNKEEDKQKIMDIEKLIFDDSTTHSNRIEKLSKYFHVVSNDENFIKGVSYHNKNTAQKKSETIHKKLFKNKYFKGLKLLGKCFYAVTSYIKINSNCEYEIIDAKGDKYVLSDGYVEFQLGEKELNDYFKLPYVETCDSIQGLSIDDKYIIYDLWSPFMTRQHAWVALTRSTNLNNIYIMKPTEKEQKISLDKFMFVLVNEKIENYKQQDKKAGRSTKDFIKYEEVRKLLFGSMMMCLNCRIPFNVDFDRGYCDFTLDRINNDLGHVAGNCTILCNHCNCSKSNK